MRGRSFEKWVRDREVLGGARQDQWNRAFSERGSILHDSVHFHGGKTFTAMCAALYLLGRRFLNDGPDGAGAISPRRRSVRCPGETIRLENKTRFKLRGGTNSGHSPREERGLRAAESFVTRRKKLGLVRHGGAGCPGNRKGLTEALGFTMAGI